MPVGAKRDCESTSCEASQVGEAFSEAIGPNSGRLPQDRSGPPIAIWLPSFAAWPTLLPDVKAGIVAMVQTNSR